MYGFVLQEEKTYWLGIIKFINCFVIIYCSHLQLTKYLFEILCNRLRNKLILIAKKEDVKQLPINYKNLGKQSMIDAVEFAYI